MKFIVEAIGQNGGRLGQIIDAGSTLKDIATPFCLIHTRKGNIPHLIPDVVKQTDLSHNPMNVTLPTIASIHDQLVVDNRGIAKFSGCQDIYGLVYISVQDGAEEIKTGKNDVNGIAVFGKDGKYKYNVHRHLELMRSLNADWIQALCDSDTTRETMSKRIRKSVDRSLNMLDETLDKMKRDENLKTVTVFGTIQGSFDHKERVRSAVETAERPVDGFVLDGFANYGPQKEPFNVDDLRTLLIETLAKLPKDKPRLMHGPFDPHTILELVELGIDIFDSSYAYISTERQVALNFRIKNRQKIISDASKTRHDQQDKEDSELRLEDLRFKNDFNPITPNCLCYTCRRHSRAYIHHLISTTELLAPILLMIHNLTHYLAFFEEMRKSIRDDQFTVYKQFIQNQFSK